MSSISSSAYYSVGGSGSGSSTKGISGLMSGMDTDAMVEGMLAGTQAKIDAQSGLKQQTLWKQEIYREMIDTINTFQSKYFDLSYGASSKNNLGSNDFFNNMISAVSGAGGLNVVSSSPSALSGDMKIKIKNLAETASLASEKTMSGDKTITGTATVTDEELTKQLGKTVVLKIDGTEVKVDLNGVTTETEMADKFNAAFAKTGVTNVTAKEFDGKLRLVSTDKNVKIERGTGSTTLGLQMSGLDNATFSDVTDKDGNVTGKMLQSDNIELGAGPSFDLTLNGVTKTIDLSGVASDGAGNVTSAYLKATLDKEVKAAFGDYVTVNMTGTDPDPKSISFGLGDSIKDQPGHELKITGTGASILGITPGSSTQFNTSQTLAELGEGDRFAFTINNVDFSFDGKTSVANMINEINRSDAGVKLSYSTMTDTMKMEATSSGAQHGIEITQTEGNILGSLFGDKINNSSSVVGGQLTTGSVSSATGGLPDDFMMTNGSLTMNVNGQDHTFKLKPKTDHTGKEIESNKTEIEKQLNDWMKTEFGTTKTTDSAGVETETANISYTGGTITAAEGFAVSFTGTKVDVEDGEAVAEAKQNDLALAMGLNITDNSNIANANTNIADIRELEGITFNGDGTGAITKLGEIKSATLANGTKVNMTFSDGRLLMTGTAGTPVDLTGNQALIDLFGGEKFEMGDGKLNIGINTDGTPKELKGEDAIFSVNGVETSRSSNTFTIEGITMNITDVTKDGEEIVISTTRDDDQIVEGMKEFVNDYNKMLESLNKYVGEDPDYKDHPPLSAAQKEEMTDKEIELWEEKSKVGLLRNDSSTTEVLQEMRNILYSTPAGSSMALYQIGIETTEDYEDKGKLQFDESAFRDALATDPGSVRTLFTDPVDGISTKLVSAMERAANTSSGSPGSMVQIAGIKSKSTEGNNDLSQRVSYIESRISDLQHKYSLEKARYWKEFSSMETAMNNYNSQSAIFSQQFG